MAKYRITPSSRAIVQSPISIGHKAEKGVEAIEFDLTAWVETYGSGTLTVIMRRWGDAIPYPIALEIDENNKATWTLSDTDTAKAGMAYAQLNYIVGDEVVKKSDIYTFRVMDSLTGEGEPPEAYESWLEHLTHLAAEAMAEVLDIEGIVTDKTLTVDGGIADGKATGDALALKADKSTTYTKTEVDQMIGDVEVETDTTLTISGAAADAKKTGDELTAIKADLDAVSGSIFSVETLDITPDSYTDNYYVDAREDYLGTQTYGTNWKLTPYLDCEGCSEVKIDAAVTTSGRAGIVFYNAENTAISGEIFPLASSGSSHETKTYTVPENAAKMKISVFKTYASSFFVEVTKPVSFIDSIQADVETFQTEITGNVDVLSAKVERANSMLAAHYMTDIPQKPLIAEMMADFAWCSMIIPAAFTGKNVVLTVSGTSGGTQLTASDITPSELSISDIGTTWVGGVLSADGVTYKVCNFKYVSGSTIEVFPALTETITDGTLSTLMYDSGASYVGLHLTENGYKAYMQNLYAKNPKHCEFGKYVARFRPETDTSSPFTWYGGTIPAAQYRFITANKNLKWLQNPTAKFYGYQYSTSWVAHTTKSGAYWEVNLGGNSGYLEAYVFAICNQLELPTDQELHVVVTIDGEVVLSQTIADSICRRIKVDYQNATTGRIEVYSNKWAAVGGAAYGFGFGRVTWWVNDLEYDLPIFPKGAVIAQQFDSWGVFHDGASGKELTRLHNAATGFTVPFSNESKGDQTSAWGLAYYYEKSWSHHPAISIHDFVINDTNSLDNAGIPATIEGPDGAEYNNKLTSAQYAANMILMSRLAVSNRIQPIFMSACQHGSTNYYTFTNALIDAMAEAVN